MKVRVYKTPTKSSPNKVAIGVPKAIQTDPNITSLNVVQEEILPPPATLTDLFTEPVQVLNPSVNAFKSVAESKLTPGFKIAVTPIGIKDSLVTPVEVEEITIPDGYIHLDDLEDWRVFNYNRTWQLSDRNFDVLPGEDRLPVSYDKAWDIIIKDRKFIPRFNSPIDSIRVYYRRIGPIEKDYEWVDWCFLKDEPNEFEYFGTYTFRAVAYHEGYPLPVQKEWVRRWEEPDDLRWSSIQTHPSAFQVRMEGVLGERINQVEAFEEGVSLGTFSLKPDEQGRIEKTFVLKGVSKAKSPEIEYRFMRRNRGHRSLVQKSFSTLERNFAQEPIRFRIRKMGEKFSINIQDPDNLMYTPVNSLDPWDGQHWASAIQRSRLIVELEITRHQDGETRDYGRYCCNVTSEIEPKFLNSPPFESKVTKIDKGFSFIFEDTDEFRDVVNLDAPDLDKSLAYEFRLIFRTAGVENCLRTGEDYIFIKETPVIIRNKRVSYKYSYSTWKEEHPRRKYTGIIPVDVEYAFMNDHLRYGRSSEAFIFASQPIPPETTKHISIDQKEWKVLYYYNDKDDEIVELPFYEFDINIPTSSQYTIDSIQVFIDNGEKGSILLGKYHPADIISVVDFLGYYEARKMVTKATNFQKAFAGLPQPSLDNLPTRSVTPPTNNKRVAKVRNQKNPTTLMNTVPKRNDVKIANQLVNNQIAQRVESGTLKYRVEIHYNDKTVAHEAFSAEIADRPRIPEEEPDNVSFAIGNKTVLPDTFQVLPSAVATIGTEINVAPVPRMTKNKVGFKR